MRSLDCATGLVTTVAWSLPGDDGWVSLHLAETAHLTMPPPEVVELLPIAPFNGVHGWGYDGVGLYGVHEPYGGPAALQRFVDAAHAAGLRPVKVNAVLKPGLNAADAPELLQYCLENDYELRVIEQMPLDSGHDWRRSTMVTAAQTRAVLGERFTLTEATEPRGASPAQRWLVDGGPGTVGIIASVSEPFCGDCDRTRLTADGQIRNCLFAREESDLRALLRAGAGDNEIARRWRAAMWAKRAGHGIDDPDFHQPDRPMSAIGG